MRAAGKSGIRRVLVTGGAGFIGSHVADLLVESGKEVWVLDNFSTGRREFVNPKVTLIEMDITSPELESYFPEEIDCVVHLAAQASVSYSMKNASEDARVNILGSINLLEVCCKKGVKRIIYANSAAGFGMPKYLPVDEEHPLAPICPYGSSKQAVEGYIKLYSLQKGLRYASLRYSNVYGPRQNSSAEGGVVAIFIDKLLSGERPEIFGDGNQTRDFVYVKDAAEATLLAIENEENISCNIGCGTEVKIKELLETIKNLVGSKDEPRYLPPREGDIYRTFFKIKKAKEELGWTPKYILEEGLMETINYYKGIKK
jgi:UDP-glucose 4-epimerase